jgi:hypothetical protein
MAKLPSLTCSVDMSAHAQFDLQECDWCLEPKASFPNKKKCPGRWLGIAEVSTDAMASYILTHKGTVVVHKSIWGFSKQEFETNEVKQTAKELDEQITRKIGNSLPVADDPCTPPPPEDLRVNLNDFEEVEDPFDPKSTKLDADKSTPEACNESLTAEVLLPRGGDFLKATVKSRKHDADGIHHSTRASMRLNSLTAQVRPAQQT